MGIVIVGVDPIPQSCPRPGRIGWTRESGRVGSRFCRILAGRVSTSGFNISIDYFLVPESI